MKEVNPKLDKSNGVFSTYFLYLCITLLKRMLGMKGLCPMQEIDRIKGGGLLPFTSSCATAACILCLGGL